MTAPLIFPQEFAAGPGDRSLVACRERPHRQPAAGKLQRGRPARREVPVPTPLGAAPGTHEDLVVGDYHPNHDRTLGVLLGPDRDHHLVKMPAVARPRATPAQPSRDRGTELQHPTPHRFIGDVEPAFGQQLLDIAVAKGEAKVEPNRVLDDLGREAMATVAERGHADILADQPLSPDPVSVTMPDRLLHEADGLSAGRDGLRAATPALSARLRVVLARAIERPRIRPSWPTHSISPH